MADEAPKAGKSRNSNRRISFNDQATVVAATTYVDQGQPRHNAWRDSKPLVGETYHEDHHDNPRRVSALWRAYRRLSQRGRGRAGWHRWR